MTSFQLFKGLSEIDPALLEDIDAQFSENVRKSSHKKLRPLLIAALISMLLLLVGCAVVYVLKLENITIGSNTEEWGYSLVDGVYVKDPHTVSTTTLTLAGLKGSNTYKACADFYTFQTEYTNKGIAMGEDGSLPEDFWTSYLDVMSEKASELAEKYGLKPEGQLLDFRTTRNLCDALGVERFTRSNPEIQAAIESGRCYDTGNFWLSINFTFPEDKGYELLGTPGVLLWNNQDSFSRDYVTIVDSGDWVERSYVTSSGSNVLILQSPSQELGYILCDRGDALMTLQLNVNIELLSEQDGVISAEYRHLTDEQIEMVADTIDFAIQPRTPTQADVEAQTDISQEATQNGYTLRMKSVITDGYVARFIIGITAPEGTTLPETGNLIFANFNGELLSDDGTLLSGGGSIETVDDGDGKDNTADLHLIFSHAISGEEAPFTLGTTWNLHLIDIVHSEWNTESGVIRNTLAEGEWLFPIIFDEGNSNYREIELLSAPITVNASTGWLEDGTDQLEPFRITSMILRSQSIGFTSDSDKNTHADFFYLNGASSYVVMKDGGRINILNQDLSEPIDLGQADYVLLADGTTVPVP